jgi:hypothetical protein
MVDEPALDAGAGDRVENASGRSLRTMKFSP